MSSPDTDLASVSRRVKNTPLKSYMWERVPRQLLDDARARGKRQTPPIALKFVLIDLLRAWTYGDALTIAYRALGEELARTPGESDRAAELGALRERIASLQDGRA